MTLTLPQSVGGIKTFNSSGVLIMRSTDGSIEMFVDVHIDAALLVEGTTVINDTTEINGVLTVNASMDIVGDATLTGRLDTGTGGVHIVGDEIGVGSSTLTFDGLGVAFSDRVYAASMYSLGALTTAGAFSHAGSTLGVFGASPVGKPTVTGSRGGNAALASLLTALADLGLITDSSSA